METVPSTSSTFKGIKRFVVLMLENRSFDHLFGYLNKINPGIVGLKGDESNQIDPNDAESPAIEVSRSRSFMMRFDPGHEFYDVQIQLYGPFKSIDPTLPPIANPPTQPALMNGFIASAKQAVDYSGDENLIMECFQPDQLPALTTLANEFALFNFWYSSLPGPTWPNRFFIHAATSGGLTDSPTTAQILEGFSFNNGTIYDRLEEAGKDWRIYHDGFPQTAGISGLRDEWINPFTKRFQEMEHFFDDVKNGALGDYNFIEPQYDTGNNYLAGNSMHPLNDIRKGEELVKKVYEALRNSSHWADTMLVITFDEHGGFYDHVPPPAAVPSGDDTKYANIGAAFLFNQLGIRVPGIVVSAYTSKGMVVGSNPNDGSKIFDHTSVLATAEKLFGLKAMTRRDATANTLDVAITLENPRLAPQDAPTSLPYPASDDAVAAETDPTNIFAADPHAPLSTNQKTMAALALACDLKLTDPKYHAALYSNHQKLIEQKDAADYIESVAKRVRQNRKSTAKTSLQNANS